jgi:hypothetical protein
VHTLLATLVRYLELHIILPFSSPPVCPSTWSISTPVNWFWGIHTLTKEQKLIMFGKRVLSRIFTPKWNKVTGIYLAVFWDVAPCSLIDINQHFRRAYCLRYLFNIYQMEQPRKQAYSCLLPWEPQTSSSNWKTQ